MITSTLLPTDEEFNAIRERLLATVDDVESRPVTPHLVVAKARPIHARRRRLLVTVSVVAACALGATLALTGGSGIAGGIESARADAVLHQASKSAFAATDPVVEPGQYLKFQTHEITRDTAAGGDSDPVDGTFTDSQTWTVYQPGTTTDDWLLVREEQRPTDPVGGKLTHEMVENWKPSPSMNGVWVGKYGRIPGWATDAPTIQALPHTVSAVRAYLYAEPVQSDSTWSADQQAWQRAVDMLTFVYVPAELRGDLFEAMTTIPGVRISQNESTVDGRTGVALGFADAHTGGLPGSPEVGQSIVIDPATGQYLGAVQDGDVTSVTVTVVDSAPKH